MKMIKEKAATGVNRKILKLKINHLLHKIDVTRSNSFGAYVGAKTLQAAFTASLIRYARIENKLINTIAIPFVGMGSECYYLKDDFDNIIVNDKDPYLVNYLNCLKDTKKMKAKWENEMKVGQSLYHNCKTSQDASDHYRSLWEEWSKEVTDFKSYNVDLANPDYMLALKYKFVLLYTYNSMSSNYASFKDRYIKDCLTTLNIDEYKPLFFKELKKLDDPETQKVATKLILNCMDAVEFIEKYDNEETAFIIDPPYFNCDKYYTATFTMTDHVRLAKKINEMHGFFVYNNYDHPNLHDWFPTKKNLWLSESFPKSSGKGSGQEIFITNAHKNKYNGSKIGNMSRELARVFYQIVAEKAYNAFNTSQCKLARKSLKLNIRRKDSDYSEAFKKLVVRLTKDGVVNKKSVIEKFGLSYYFLSKWKLKYSSSTPLIKQYHHIAEDAIARGCKQVNYTPLKNIFLKEAYRTNDRNMKIGKFLGFKSLNLCGVIQPEYKSMAA